MLRQRLGVSLGHADSSSASHQDLSDSCPQRWSRHPRLRAPIHETWAPDAVSTAPVWLGGTDPQHDTLLPLSLGAPLTAPFTYERSLKEPQKNWLRGTALKPTVADQGVIRFLPLEFISTTIAVFFYW